MGQRIIYLETDKLIWTHLLMKFYPKIRRLHGSYGVRRTKEVDFLVSAGRLEFKIGLFVIVLLAMAAVMSIKFSESGFGFVTYLLAAQFPTLGLLSVDSPVLMFW